MEKTRLGLSAKAVGVIVTLLFFFGGYTVGLLAVGYILLCEKDQALRVSALTALVVALAYSLLNIVISLLPDIVYVFESMLAIFDVYVNLNVIRRISNFLSGILSLLKTAAYVVLVVMAVLDKPIQLAPVKKLLDESK